MQKLTDQERLRPWMGFALFGFAMLVFVTVCAWMQLNWGIPGLVLTELILAGISIGFCLIRKVKISEVLPIKKVTARDFFGCVLLLISTYMFSMISIFAMGTLFPGSSAEATELGSFLYDGGLGLIPLILIVAVLPAICEEILHRGAILSTFRSLDKEWIAVVLVGLFFSINHLSILRGPFTFLLGAVFAYVVIRKNNILLTMIMHCMLNSFSVCISYFTLKNSDMDFASVNVSVGLDTLGLYIAIMFLAPILFVTGKMLLVPESHKKKHYAIAGIASAAMLIGGIVIMMLGAGKPIFSANGPLNMAGEGTMEFGTIEIQEEKDYTVAFVVTGSSGNFRVEVTDENGEVACGGNMNTGAMQMYNSTVKLPEGKYTITLINLDDTPVENAAYTLVMK